MASRVCGLSDSGTALMAKSKKRLLVERMKQQAEACSNLFEQIHYESHEPTLRLDVDCYYVGLDDTGQPRIRDLVQYLARMLAQYVHTLSAQFEAIEEMDLAKLSQLQIDANRFLVAKAKRGELGEMILWMLLEGVQQVPKVLTKHPHKTNTNLQNFGSDAVHASLDPEDQSLVLFIGESKLKHDVGAAIDEAISSIVDHFGEKFGKVAIDQDIYMIDRYAADDIDDQLLAQKIHQFADPGSLERKKAKFKVAVFTGYNSKQLGALKNVHFSKASDHMKTKYKTEVVRIANRIKKAVEKNPTISRMRVVWFVLPFSTIEEFVSQFVQTIVGIEAL